MSRRDKYHDIVKNALIREGWTITHDPYYFVNTDPQLSTDIGAERLIAAENATQKIVVEVKSFLKESQVVELEKAIGQYGLYRRFLAKQASERVLYLAVPRHAFEDIFSRQVGREAIEEFHLLLFVYSLLKNEPLIWNPQ
ncbi:element excision factor XisH family protein [Candidatus Parabeggiatoa sp. HSG14]|uniref:element excision factor XisH family protein n=1 Tax=Candidatus Parabeggiatoa sp. HSG14 TaxID=3055593 RepID=UPI0025A929E4|nr:element excision factor XisH family protein [Thiotrichales bacterium HSG14]